MTKPASLLFFGNYVLILSLAAFGYGLWALFGVSPAHGAAFLAWGVWGAFCSTGFLLHDGACRRGVLWLVGLTIAGAFLLLRQAILESSLEAVFTDITLRDLLYPANLGLLTATLFHLSGWRALEYTGEAHGHA